MPATADGFVRDVSAYPDGTELMLAADVLITDYSSMMVDFANTGRPMLFFTYDLDAYEDEIRGFYLDDSRRRARARCCAPATRSRTRCATRRGAAPSTPSATPRSPERFCELDDGHAAARVVDRLF